MESVTYATKAKRNLAQNGIEARVVKLTDKRTGACVYGIEISSSDSFDVALILKNNGIEYTTYSEK